MKTSLSTDTLKKKLSLLMLIAFVALASCQKEGKQTMQSLKINLQEGDLLSVHPHDVMIYLRGVSTAKTLFEGLTRINEQGKICLAGAQSLEISQNRLRYSFVLKDNRWSNGTPVTAYQYERAWKEVLSPTSRCSRADLLYMIKNAQLAKQGKVPLDAVGVKATDAKTLVIELEYPSPYFIELLAQPLCAPLIDSNAHPTAFNGPFYLDLWERGHLMRLKPNPYFWNHKAISLKQIELFMIPDSAAAFNAYENGQIDWIGVPTSAMTPEQIHALKKSKELRQHPIERAFWIYLNTQKHSLSSSNIRHALSLALNRTAITEHILLGGNPLGKILSPDLLPGNNRAFLKENQEEAKRRFELGLSELGLTRETFPPIVVSYAQHPNRKEFAQYLQETWSRTFGIEVRLQFQEWNVLRTNLEKGLFDVCASFEATYYSDPLEIMERLGEKNSANFCQWVHPGYRQLITAVIHTEDTQARLDILGKAEKILLDQLPIIPVCSDRFLFAHRKGLKGYAFDSLGALDLSYASFEGE